TKEQKALIQKIIKKNCYELYPFIINNLDNFPHAWSKKIKKLLGAQEQYMVMQNVQKRVKKDFKILLESPEEERRVHFMQDYAVLQKSSKAFLAAFPKNGEKIVTLQQKMLQHGKKIWKKLFKKLSRWYY